MGGEGRGVVVGAPQCGFCTAAVSLDLHDLAAASRVRPPALVQHLCIQGLTTERTVVRNRAKLQVEAGQHRAKLQVEAGQQQGTGADWSRLGGPASGASSASRTSCPSLSISVQERNWPAPNHNSIVHTDCAYRLCMQCH